MNCELRVETHREPLRERGNDGRELRQDAKGHGPVLGADCSMVCSVFNVEVASSLELADTTL